MTILNHHPLTTTPDTLVLEAIALMSQSNSSYILMLAHRDHRSPPVGLLTTTDVVYLTASGTDLNNLSKIVCMGLWNKKASKKSKKMFREVSNS